MFRVFCRRKIYVPETCCECGKETGEMEKVVLLSEAQEIMLNILENKVIGELKMGSYNG